MNKMAKGIDNFYLKKGWWSPARNRKLGLYEFENTATLVDDPELLMETLGAQATEDE